jgi:hypothetical protein
MPSGFGAGAGWAGRTLGQTANWDPGLALEVFAALSIVFGMSVATTLLLSLPRAL